jgi:molecular chaperone DnaK
VFSTAVDNQPNVDINVLQGERPMAKDNKSIGLFRLDGIMPARRGVPQIEVTFDISADGILKVSAVDKATNKEQSITIEQSGSLSKEEIERIKKEAEQFAESDKKEREIADTINKGDGIVFSSEKMLEEQGDKMSEEKRTAMQSLLEEMKTAVKDKKVEDINRLEEEINKVWNEVASAMYASQAQEQAAQSANPTENTNEENIQNADFEEIN